MSIRHRSVGIARDQQLAAIVDRWSVTAPTAVVPPTSFLLGQNAAGLWVVKTYDGKTGGLFRSQKDAVHFVHRECQDHVFDLVYLPDGLELDITAKTSER